VRTKDLFSSKPGDGVESRRVISISFACSFYWLKFGQVKFS